MGLWIGGGADPTDLADSDNYEGGDMSGVLTIDPSHPSYVNPPDKCSALTVFTGLSQIDVDVTAFATAGNIRINGAISSTNTNCNAGNLEASSAPTGYVLTAEGASVDFTPKGTCAVSVTGYANFNSVNYYGNYGACTIYCLGSGTGGGGQYHVFYGVLGAATVVTDLGFTSSPAIVVDVGATVSNSTLNFYGSDFGQAAVDGGNWAVMNWYSSAGNQWYQGNPARTNMMVGSADIGGGFVIGHNLTVYDYRAGAHTYDGTLQNFDCTLYVMNRTCRPTHTGSGDFVVRLDNLSWPSNANVRNGINFGVNNGGAYDGTGTCAVPGAVDVRSGTAVDAGVGSLAVPAANNVRTGIAVDAGVGTCAVPAAANVRSGTAVDAGVGSLAVPAANNVRTGVAVDAGVGSCAVPATTNVRSGTAIDAGVGSLVVPAAGDVKAGTVYDNGTVGTYAGGGGSSTPRGRTIGNAGRSSKE